MASMAALLAVEVVPALAQSATTDQPSWTAVADNSAAGSVHAPNYDQAQTTLHGGAHIGDGSRPDYLMHQRELQNMPGYSVGGNG